MIIEHSIYKKKVTIIHFLPVFGSLEDSVYSMVMVYGFLSNQDFSVKGMVKSMCIGYRQGALLKSPRVNEGSKHRNTILDRITLAAQYRREGSFVYRPPPP